MLLRAWNGKLLSMAVETVADDQRLQTLSANVLKLALPDSAETIAKEVIRLATEKG